MTRIVQGIVLLLLTIPLFGQGPTATVVIPYDFVTQDKVMPAGRYAITPDRNIVVLKNLQTNEIVSLFCHYVNQYPPLDKTALRFRKDGDVVVLHQIVLRGHEYALDVVHGREVPELILAER